MIDHLFKKAETLLSQWPVDTPIRSKSISIIQLNDLFKGFFNGSTGLDGVVLYGGKVRIGPDPNTSGTATVDIKRQGSDTLVKPEVCIDTDGTIKSLLSTLYHEITHLDQLIRIVHNNKAQLLQNSRLNRWQNVFSRAAIDGLHRHQQNHPVSDPEASYRDPMEIAAHAREIAHQLKQEGATYEEVRELLEDPDALIQATGSDVAIEWYFNRLGPDLKNRFIHAITKQFQKV